MEKQFIVGMFQKIDTRDWDGLSSFFRPDVVYERPGYEPIVGLDALLHFYREVRVIAAGRHALSDVVVGESSAACWGRFVGKHKSGEELDERFADVYTFADGKIKTRASYFFRPAV
jgi:ketosteroid isomerase-like protein